MDAVATMGNLLPADAWGRDAVHVAVFSAYSTEALKPGQNVSLVNEEGDRDVRVTGLHTDRYVGIVDPFLQGKVSPNERFWVYLYPRTITGLSHRWSHPAFGDDPNAAYATPASKLESETWLRDFCEQLGISYWATLNAVERHLTFPFLGGAYLHMGDEETHAEIPGDFWNHVEIVLGRNIAGKHRASYFTCSC